MKSVRTEQLKKVMEQKNLDAALLGLSENVILMTQQFWSRIGLVFVFVPRNGDACLLATKEESKDLPDDFDMEVHRFGAVSLEEGNALDNVANLLKELGRTTGFPQNGRLGMDIGAQSVAPALCDGEVTIPGAGTIGAVKEAFPGVEIVDIMPDILKMRSIKTAEDIEKLERVNRLAGAGIEQFRRKLESGEDCTEIELAVLVEGYIERHARQFGGIYARAWAQVSSGPRTVDAWNNGVVTTDRQILDGEPAMIEMGTALDGYFADRTLTFCKKGDPGEMARIIEAVDKAQKAALQAIKPGVRCCEVDAAARAVLRDYGYEQYFNHGLGHGTGFAYHDGSPVLNGSSEEVLEVGMVHSVEPGVYIPGVGGARLEINSLVTENGAHVLGSES